MRAQNQCGAPQSLADFACCACSLLVRAAFWAPAEPPSTPAIN